MPVFSTDRHNILLSRCLPMLLACCAPAYAHAQSTIVVTTTGDSIDFSPEHVQIATLQRPGWDMVPSLPEDDLSDPGPPDPSTGVWVPLTGAPSVAELLAELAQQGDGLVSLCEAIVIANTTQYIGSETGPTTIELAHGATYTLSQPDNWWYGANALPPIHAHIVIEGHGAIIERALPATDDTDRFRLIYVAGKFHNLVDGDIPPPGAPVYTEGHLVLRDLTLRNGRARGGNAYKGGGGAGLGGAIYNQGVLELERVTLRDNLAQGGSTLLGADPIGRAGGGIFGDAGFNAGGGFRYAGDSGQAADPPLLYIPPTGGGFLSNRPRAEGGGFASIPAGDTVATGSRGISRFGGDGADGNITAGNCPAGRASSGGGFLSSATANNRGDGGGFSAQCNGGGGGAFGGGGGYAELVAYGYRGGAGGVGGGGAGGNGGNSMYAGADGGFGAGGGDGAFSGFGGGGGIRAGAWGFGGGSGGSTLSGGGGGGFGGAVFNHLGSVQITDSTLTANTAAGGSTPNWVFVGTGGAGYGGAIFNLDGQVEIVDSHLQGNTVLGSTSPGGASAHAAGGAVFNHAQSEDVGVANLRELRGVTWSPSLTRVTLRNTPLHGSIGGSDCFASGTPRQQPTTDVAYVAQFSLDHASTIATDATGINSCNAFRIAAVRFTFSLIDNAEGDFAAQGWLDPASPFQANLRAAADAFTRELDGTALLHVRVQAQRNIGALTGGAFPGWIVDAGQDPDLLEPSAISKLRTGASPTRAYDLSITVNAPAVATGYWIDPTPEDRSDTVVGQPDLQSALLHELIHGLGVSGYRARSGPDYGQVQGAMSLFDELTVLESGAPQFIGSASTTMADDPVALTQWGNGHPNSASDFYHVGRVCNGVDDSTVPPLLREALMSACPFPTDGRYKAPTALDFALLQDLGYDRHTLQIVSVQPDPPVLGLPITVRVHLRGHDSAPTGNVSVVSWNGDTCIAPLAPQAESDGRAAVGQCALTFGNVSEIGITAHYPGAGPHPARSSAQHMFWVESTVPLRYTAAAHGSLSGNLAQAVNIGGSGTPVTATPDAGHVFAGWSDGRQDNPRTDSNVQAPVDVLALFAAIGTYTLHYTAGPNGGLLGNTSQQVQAGENGTPVTAVAGPGYRFVGWSDGRGDNPRVDADVLGNVAAQANFALAPDSIFANGFE